MNKQLQALFAGAFLVVLSPQADAAGRTLVVSSFGGNWEQGVKRVVEKFKETHPDVDVVVTLPGNSAQILAKLRAEKNNPTIDVALIAGGVDAAALQDGLLMKHDYSKLSNYGELYDVAKNPVEGLGPAVSFSGVKLAYNTNYVKSAPTSWEALWDPQYKGKVGMMNPTNNGGVMLLYLLAKLNGGDVANIDPAFAKMQTLKAQNPQFFESNPASVDMFVQETMWLSPMFDGRVGDLKREGFPIDMTCPDEGCFVSLTTANIVQGSKNVDLAEEFINMMIQADVQATFAETASFGPVNSKTELPENVEANVIYGADEVKKLISLPWHEISPVRDQWIERWNREILSK